MTMDRIIQTVRSGAADFYNFGGSAELTQKIDRGTASSLTKGGFTRFTQNGTNAQLDSTFTNGALGHGKINLTNGTANVGLLDSSADIGTNILNG
jgi:hypothetical protein